MGGLHDVDLNLTFFAEDQDDAERTVEELEDILYEKLGFEINYIKLEESIGVK